MIWLLCKIEQRRNLIYEPAVKSSRTPETMLTTQDFLYLYYHFHQTEIVVTMVLPFSVVDAEKLSIP